MATEFETPQDAEDALYDAFEAGLIDGIMAVWEDSDEIACLLPMTPLLQGRQAVLEGWRRLLEAEIVPEISVVHRQWIESPDLAVHLIEEKLVVPDSPQPAANIFASNIYRRTAQGWRLIVHQTSPLPPAAPRGPRIPI